MLRVISFECREESERETLAGEPFMTERWE